MGYSQMFVANLMSIIMLQYSLFHPYHNHSNAVLADYWLYTHFKCLVQFDVTFLFLSQFFVLILKYSIFMSL